MAITEISDEIEIETPVSPLRVFVLGKTWGWTSKEEYSYPESIDDLPKEWKKGEVVFRREKEEPG